MYSSEETRPHLEHIESDKTFDGRVSNDVSALTDDLYVNFAQFDSDDDPQAVHRHGPVLGWDARQDGSLPGINDRCLVAVSDLGEYWMIAWTPYD